MSSALPPVQDAIDSPAGVQIEFAKLFRRYAIPAVLLALTGALGGAFAVVMTAPMYRADALIEVEPMNGSVLKMQAMQQYLGDANGVEQVDLLTQTRIIMSSSFLRRVLLRLQLNGNNSAPPVQAGIFAKLRSVVKPNATGRIPPELGVEGIDVGKAPVSLAMALRSLKAEPVTGTHLLQISCESTSPKFASDFLNTLTDEYIQRNYEDRMETVRSTTQWITGQLEEARAKVAEADAKLEEYVRSSGSTLVGQDNTLPQMRLADLQNRLGAAQSDLAHKQILYESVHRTSTESLLSVIEDPNVRQYQNRIAELRREEATLTTTLTPEHPKVKNIEAQIANLQASQQKELSAAVKRIDNQYAAAKRDQELLKADYTAAAQQVANQSGKGAEYNTLKKASESARETYQALLLQANQASVVGSLPINNIQAIDRATPAEMPYKPKPLVDIGAGAAVGLALCCGIAFLREKMDQSVGSPSHARRLFDLPQLGVIPSVEDTTTRWHLPGLRRPLLPENGMNIVVADAPGKNVGPRGSAGNPLLAESFRVTLASLMRESSGSHRLQVILVTSPGLGEGKTTITCNLGIALAETGRRVLVLDGDFRRPRIHNLFQVANTRGITDLVTAEVPVASYKKDELGTRTSVPNLLVLPNGSQAQNITKVLYSSRLRELIQRLRGEFDTILIDAPPMLPVADVRVMSAFVDGVVLILRSGITDKESAAEALSQLRTDGTLVLGTVLNDWKPSKGEAKRRYYYDFDGRA